MVKFCFECGAKNNGGRFCAECGTKFTTPDGGGGASAAPGGNSNGAANAVAAQLNQQMGTTAFTGGAVTAAAPHVANAGFAAAKSAYRNESMGGAVPMAVPVGGGAAAGSFNYGSSRPSAFANNGTNGIPPPPPPPPPPPAPAAPSAFRSSFNGSFNGGNGNNNNGNATNAPAFRSSFSSSNKSFNNNSFNGGGYETQAAGQAPEEPVPPAATGAEAQEVYESCVQTIRAARGGGNETGVKAFKQNCKAFGLKQIDVKTFYDSLVAELGLNDTRNFVPHLSRLIPDDMLRKDLIEYNSRQQRVSAFSSGANGQPAPYLGSAGRDSSSSSDSNSSSRRSFSSGGAGKSKGILKNRYADHPNCDICNVGFDVTKRRHQCRRCGLNVCNSCTPVRLLIPPEMVIENAKKYEPSVPQRVCIQCAPQLHQYQDELVAQYAQSKEQNMHQSKGAIHVPFSNSLMKECNNAADIIGNFFRDSWGSSTDRSIPVAFLQKAHGLAIMTIIKAGFLVTGKIGTGLVVAKLPDGSWSAPSAIGTIGLGGGFEIGGEIVEVMIILGSEGAVKVFHKPQVNLGAGLDVTVGPYGRSALAAAAVSTSGLNANYSYSQSKGLYAGISLQGAVIAARSDLNRKFYGRDLPPGEILSGYVEQPAAARPLYEAIDMAMQGVEDHKNEAMRRSSIMGPCRLCNCPMFVAHTHQVWNKSCKTCKHVH